MLRIVNKSSSWPQTSHQVEAVNDCVCLLQGLDREVRIKSDDRESVVR